MTKRKCLTPGAVYKLHTQKPNSFRPQIIHFSVEVPSDKRVTVKLLKKMEKDFHDSIESTLAPLWKEQNEQQA
jgi:hypothetical protein